MAGNYFSGFSIHPFGILEVRYAARSSSDFRRKLYRDERVNKPSISIHKNRRSYSNYSNQGDCSVEVGVHGKDRWVGILWNHRKGHRNEGQNFWNRLAKSWGLFGYKGLPWEQRDDRDEHDGFVVWRSELAQGQVPAVLTLLILVNPIWLSACE